MRRFQEEDTMVREILFRGKRMDNGEWVYGFILHAQNDDSWCITNEVEYLHDVDGNTVGQYTGLGDKNGVKIFDGDIVAWRDKNFILNGHYTYGFDGYKYGDELIVRRLKSGFMLCKKHDGMPDIPNANDKIDNYAFWNYHGFFEVIGNIHDNQGLLEVRDGTTD